jgi:hypothetical protein
VRRDSLADRLDHALRPGQIVVLDGMPQVGRSSFVHTWAAERGDVALAGAVDAAGATFLLHDHMDAAAAAHLIARVRSPEWVDVGPGMLVVPDDIATVRSIRNTLTAKAEVVRLEPMTLEDCRAEALPAVPAGPVVVAAAPGPGAPLPVMPTQEVHWLRGGMPDALYAATDAQSMAWRRNLLVGMLGRDYSAFGVEAATRLPDVALELARRNGGEHDEDGHPWLRRRELGSAVHVLKEVGLVRRLPNLANGLVQGKVHKDKLYVRDTGLLHALVGVEDLLQLRAWGDVGESFEGYVIEALIRASGNSAAGFFRAETVPGQGADEVDLVLDFTPRRAAKLAIEVKKGEGSKARPGFARACALIQPTDTFVVHSGAAPADAAGMPRLDLASAIARVAAAAAG